MNKINEQIKKIHEQMKQRGEWDGLPKMAGGQGLLCTMSKERRLNAYIAQKLDLITEAIVDAMKARRKNDIDTAKYRLDTANFISAYSVHTEGTYQDHLALALIRTMDLMGFYGVEYSWKEMRTIPVINDSEWKMRDILRQISDMHYGLRPNVNQEISADYFDAIITAIIDIVELDKIDIQWHIDARLKYESGDPK